MAKTKSFKRYGRCYHLKIRSAEDLSAAVELDEAHWVATNAPINTINCDRTFLDLLDTDDNGRIMCQEVREAITWLLGTLSDHEGITAAGDTLSLDAINTETDEGRRIRSAVEKMLAHTGDERITLRQVREVKAQQEATPVSEAGVVLPEAAQDAETREFLADIVATVPAAAHPSGSPGVAKAQLDEFLQEARQYLDWRGQGVIPSDTERTEIMPLGANTPDAYGVLVAVRGKIDQYLAQCEAMVLDERFVQQMGWTDAELRGLDFDDPAVIEDVLRQAPLAKARSDRRLNFDQDINPYYTQLLEKFCEQVMAPVLGQAGDSLSAKQWRQIRSTFAAHQAWVQARPDSAVGSLDAQKLQAYLDQRFASAIETLIADSTQTAFVLDNVRLTEKLVLYQAHMIEFVNNFVSFPDLYSPLKRAMFEMGSLVMDGRRFNFAVRVANRSEHAAVAKNSNMYLLYVEIAPRGGGEKYEIAVPVTSGGKGNLCVGKRGMFVDVAGNTCDARVVSIIDNPISLSEAFVSPFRRIAALVTGKIESITAKAEQKLDKQTSGVLSGPAQPAVTGQKPPAAGMLMGVGVAAAALGSAMAYITKTLADTSGWAILAGVVIAILMVLLPTSIIGILKLRKRDFSAILEGAGWAINARMRLNSHQGRFFTQRPRYPKGARGVPSLRRRAVLAVIIVIAILAGGYFAHRYVQWPAGKKETSAQLQPSSSQPADESK